MTESSRDIQLGNAYMEDSTPSTTKVISLWLPIRLDRKIVKLPRRSSYGWRQFARATQTKQHHIASQGCLYCQYQIGELVQCLVTAVYVQVLPITLQAAVNEELTDYVSSSPRHPPTTKKVSFLWQAVGAITLGYWAPATLETRSDELAKHVPKNTTKVRHCLHLDIKSKVCDYGSHFRLQWQTRRVGDTV